MKQNRYMSFAPIAHVVVLTASAAFAAPTDDCDQEYRDLRIFEEVR